jgi:hypothetical protein
VNVFSFEVCCIKIVLELHLKSSRIVAYDRDFNLFILKSKLGKYFLKSNVLLVLRPRQ